MPIAMAGLTLGAIVAGYRVAFALAGSAAVFVLVSDLPPSFFRLLVSRVHANVLSNWLLVAIPMFVFMGLVLERSGVAERALVGAQRALGGTAAGMGMAVLLVGTLLAAASGIVGASVVLLTLLALPQLRRAGYPASTASGLVAASGTLAILVPPSVMLILLGDQLRVPVTDMFAGAIVPGLLLIGLYALLVLVASRGLRPGAPVPDGASGAVGAASAAAVPTDDRRDAGGKGGRGVLAGLILDVAPLLALVLAVLGSIVTGVATPTEASGLGALGALGVAALRGRFSVRMTMDAARETVIATSMVMLVIVGATCFSAVLRGVGGDEAVRAALDGIGGGPWTMLAVFMLAIFTLGFVLDWLEITLILMPLFAPIVATLDFGNGLVGIDLMLWFGVLCAVNLQSSFLTPPFGFSLFYLRGAAGDAVPVGELYRGVLPFIALQLVALALIARFPSIVTGASS